MAVVCFFRLEVLVFLKAFVTLLSMLSTHKNHCVLVSYRPLAALARRAACPQAKKAINPFDGRPMPCMFDPTCPAALPDAQFERGSIGEYKPRSGCSPLHGGCAWMRTGHSTQRARAAKHLGGK